MATRVMLILTALVAIAVQPSLDAAEKPNVIVLLTDDQGYGDLSCHGNPVIRTPNMDKVHDAGIRLTDFHVSPMCTPTRGQIMTGCDCLANGACRVCSGRTMLRKNLPTMADVFAANGYRTGLFGKWHLGDDYPYRPIDRGFQESITFPGWGLASCPNHWNNAYFDDWLLHNGRLRQYKGYCTDVWFREAMAWIKSCAARHERFFVYLPPNAAHVPLWVPEEYVKPYRGKVAQNVARFFGMIACIDQNMGRLDAMLKELGLYDNTIVIFMTDNGGTIGVKFFNAGMRGQKTDYYEGGHRVPCFIRWPSGGLHPPADLDELTCCQDLLPTLIDLCGLHPPAKAQFDGISLSPLLHGRKQPELAQRMPIVQFAFFDENEVLQKWRSAVMWNKWRLVKGKELYNIGTDPGQKVDVAAKNPDVVARLRDRYEKWWDRVEPLTKEFQPLHVGAEQQNPVTLTSHDWIAPNTANAGSIREGAQCNGPWEVLVERAGEYRFELRRWPVEADLALTAVAPAYKGALGSFPAGKPLPIAKARLKIGDTDLSKPVETSDKSAVFNLHLPAGRTRLFTWFYNGTGKELCGAYYVTVLRKATGD